eukprot:scaffold73536_cov66-Phaeocystis_antarctica.AAC.1
MSKCGSSTTTVDHSIFQMFDKLVLGARGRPEPEHGLSADREHGLRAGPAPEHDRRRRGLVAPWPSFFGEDSATIAATAAAEDAAAAADRVRWQPLCRHIAHPIAESITCLAAANLPRSGPSASKYGPTFCSCPTPCQPCEAAEKTCVGHVPRGLAASLGRLPVVDRDDHASCHPLPPVAEVAALADPA